jgi:hypothetical protein
VGRRSTHTTFLYGLNLRGGLGLERYTMYDLPGLA